MKILEVDRLRKSYGEREAVKGISFDIEQGEIFALIGPNGAGKTTTLRMIATLLSPSGGDALLCGESIVKDPVHARENITYLPDEAGAYKNMKGIDYLRFMAELYSDSKKRTAEMVEYASEVCGLGERLNDKISTYSKGMMRKLLITRAVMPAPKLAILDEPTSGLDVMNALEIRDLVKRLALGGTAFLISSHNMLEIEYLSERVAIISEGVIHDVGKPSLLKEKYGADNLEEVFAKIVGRNVWEGRAE